MQRKNKFNKENIVKLLLFRVYLSIITVQLGMLSDLLGINKHVSVSKFVLKYRANIKYNYVWYSHWIYKQQITWMNSTEYSVFQFVLTVFHLLNPF